MAIILSQPLASIHTLAMGEGGKGKRKGSRIMAIILSQPLLVENQNFDS